jgi:hypothetical protein
MARRPGRSRKADEGAALRARYRASRARLLDGSASATPIAAADAPPGRARSRVSPRPWRAQLIAFNNELRRLFLRTTPRVPRQSGERIRDVVTQHYGITIAEIAGDATIRRIAWPRQVAMYIGVRHAGLSTARIGKLLGDRDHSTVRFALSAVEARMAKDRALAEEISELIASCGLGGPA